jgi:hypothetical protein
MRKASSKSAAGAAALQGAGVFDPFTEAELLTIQVIDGEVSAVGWVLHHGYTGALPSTTKLTRVSSQTAAAAISSKACIMTIC